MKRSSLFTLLLFLVFVLCALFTVMTGSRVYENIQTGSDQIFYEDTSISYICLLYTSLMILAPLSRKFKDF